MANPQRPRAGKVIHPRIPEDLHSEIQAYAERTARSVNNAVIYLLRRGLESERHAPR